MSIYRNEVERNILIAWKHEARCRTYATRRALRRIIHVLMNVYTNEDGWVALIERRHARERESKGDILSTPVTAWVEDVHGRDAHKGEKLKKRIIHAIATLHAYIRLVSKPADERKTKERQQQQKRQRAKWVIYAYLVRTYKNDKQQQMLEDRAMLRNGLICAHTRNVGRLTPKGDVSYDL